MKRTWIIFLVLGLAIASCTNPNKVKESEEYKRLQAERDSLLMQSAQSDAEVADMMAVISDVEANFDKIREAEKYIATQSGSGELTQDAKSRVNDNFKMIQDIMAKNKAQLAELNKKVKSSNSQVATLKNTIDRLNREMQESSNRIVELQNQLAAKDEQITQLSSDITALANEAEQQAQTITSQDRKLHTAYYVFGTQSELKEQKILSGGFLQATKVMTDTFNKDYFLEIDIRRVTEIPLYAPKAKIWSNHPEGTYEYLQDGDKNLVLHITDTQRFWSLTKYLIVEVH